MLSPDAELPLTEIDMNPGRVFCIGGVVDRSVRKGLTLGFANENGISVRRLPVRPYTWPAQRASDCEIILVNSAVKIIISLCYACITFRFRSTLRYLGSEVGPVAVQF